jgi:hypothetical protein
MRRYTVWIAQCLCVIPLIAACTIQKVIPRERSTPDAAVEPSEEVLEEADASTNITPEVDSGSGKSDAGVSTNAGLCAAAPDKMLDSAAERAGSACLECMRTTCCDEVALCMQSADCLGWSRAWDNCERNVQGDQDRLNCFGQMERDFPNGRTLLRPVTKCSVDRCSPPCTQVILF